MDGFGQRLVTERKKKGLSQKEFASILDITPTRLNYWEKDKREPDLSMFNKIVMALNVDANILLGLNNTVPAAGAGEGEELAEDAAELMADYGKLNPTGKGKARDYTRDLTHLPDYTADKPKFPANTFDNAVVVAFPSSAGDKSQADPMDAPSIHL